ncbi:hypothetical protein JQ580_00125 [Bradyrhizobium japonicum]|uniref:hypothetical protein n=1 Tax=Bradyrhizobium japonicum TaxID=375 RepID=UPI001BA8FDFC|nr:hypothetical protein [Bradyrhizobium japonicum]MBR0989121.1 hypothetical protein [Bradyrhizobium japonicum]
MDFLDDLIGPAENPAESTDSKSRGGALVVPDAAPSGAFLNIEAAAFREIAHLPAVVFEEEDENGRPAFSNAAEFQDAMGMVSPPTQAEALDWILEVLVANAERHGERLAAAFAEAVAAAPKNPTPDPAGVPVRARMPHSTGTSRGQRN